MALPGLKQYEVADGFSGITARPIQQVSKSEGAVLEKIRSLVVLDMMATLPSVVTTMITMVMERIRDQHIISAGSDSPGNGGFAWAFGPGLRHPGEVGCRSGTGHVFAG